MGRLTPRKRRKPNPEKSAQSKEVWAAKERRKNARGRYEGALVLSKMMLDAGHLDAAAICDQYASILAVVNNLDD
jgi:hypothetical protein